MVYKKTKAEKDYTAKDIYVLRGLEPVRRRPAMYIGSTGIEGVHHLLKEVVFNSLTHETPIVIQIEGKIQIRKIGELIDRYFEENQNSLKKANEKEAEILRGDFGIKTLSFDPNTLKLNFQSISSLIRHRVNSEIYRITLQNNREVEITPYHSLFTLKEGKVVPIEGKEIKIGTPIVVPRVWPGFETLFKEIDLIDALLKLPPKKTRKIVLRNITPTMIKGVYSALRTFFLENCMSFKISFSDLYYMYKNYGYLPFNVLRYLGRDKIQSIKEKVLLGAKKSSLRIPPKLKINSSLVELLGVFTAEGCLIKHKDKKEYESIVFSLGANEKELIKYIKKIILETFGYRPSVQYVHQTAETISINSILIALIFKEIIKTGENSSNKKVPDLIFNLARELRERYLIGYLAGDGYPAEVWTSYLIQNTAPSAEERRKFTLVTKNRYLASNLSYLLSSLNKTYSIGKRKRKKEKRFVKVIYKGKNKRAEINSQKFSFAIDFYWNTNSSYINYLPARGIISKVFWGWPHTFSLNFYGNGGVTQNKVLSLLKKQKLILYQGSLDFLNSDLGILRVRKIEKIKYKKPYVYDISVPDGENFVGGFSPICCHNSIDEAMMGHCNEIKVTLLPQNRVKVEDNGRGIPVEIHPQTKKSALETVMTYLHAGAKFGGKVYASTGGLHGVGVSAVCALSKYMRAEVCRDGNLYCQEYSRGKAKNKVKKIGSCEKSGTTVLSEPDPKIFKKIEWIPKKILNFLRQQAYLTRGVKITFLDKRNEFSKPYTFYFEGGLVSYIKHLTRGRPPRHPHIFYGIGEKNGILVEAVLSYTKEYESFEESFANNVFTSEGGTHLTGFRIALTRTLNDYAKKEGPLKKEEENLSGQDVREGLTGVIAVKVREPQFEGQTKKKLGNPEVRQVVSEVVSEKLLEFLEQNPRDARTIIEGCLLAQKARRAAKTARETILKKGILRGLALPGKLADCSSRKPEESELYLVEGESAGGSGRQARDRRFQAILPLKGKILNVEKARLDKILSSQEIKSLIVALGTAIAEDFDINKARYHRIIIMVDSDVDGQHLRTLLLTLFYRYFKPIIEKGYLYIAQPPLYKIQAGKEIKYAYSEDQKREVLDSFKKSSGISIQRYKGLGEMNPEELWVTTMNPENRILLKVEIEDAKEADKIFDTLMGEEVLPRKKFIQVYARKVKNLDI